MDTYAPLLPYVRNFFSTIRSPHTCFRSNARGGEQSRYWLPCPPSLSARIFKNLQVNQAAALLKNVPTDTFKEIVEHLHPQQGASIFMHIPDEVRKRLIQHLPDKTKDEIQELLIYPRGSVGSLMTTRFVAFHSDVKTKDVIDGHGCNRLFCISRVCCNISEFSRISYNKMTLYELPFKDNPSNESLILKISNLLSSIFSVTLKSDQKGGKQND